MPNAGWVAYGLRGVIGLGRRVACRRQDHRHGPTQDEGSEYERDHFVRIYRIWTKRDRRLSCKKK